MVNQSTISGYIAKAQRAQASYMLSAVRYERSGEDAIQWYRKSRYLSAGIRVLSNSNNGLQNFEIEQIIQEMIEQGAINDFSSSVIVFPPQPTLVSPNINSLKFIDLKDYSGGALSSFPTYLLRVNSAGTALEFVTSNTVQTSTFTTGITIGNSVYYEALTSPITPAQIKTGNSVPIDTGIPLPAVGKAIEVISSSIIFQPGVTFTSTYLSLITDTATDPQVVFGCDLTIASAQFTRGEIQALNHSIVSNKRLMIQADADSAVGTGVCYISIFYRVITIPTFS